MLKTYSPQTPATVEATAAALKAASEELSALAQAMKDLGFDELQATNGDQRRRCMEYAENFVGAVKAAIRTAREDRGDFGPVSSTNHKPKRKR